MPIANVFSAAYDFDSSDPDGYRCGEARVGAIAGGTSTTVRAYEVPPGQTICPYHYEYEEEWLLVLQGDLILRTPAGEQPLRAGDLVCFAAGPDGAHRVTNRADGPARAIMFSSSREPAVAVYPDSGKIGVWPGNRDDDLMVRRADGDVDYWDGELT